MNGIDSIVIGMTQEDVLACVGEPDKTLEAHETVTTHAMSWLYRDMRQSGGYIYVMFDGNGCVVEVQGSVSFGVPLDS